MKESDQIKEIQEKVNNINKKIVTLAKKTTPYIKVLAIKKDKMHLLGEIAKSATLITRSGDEQKLNKKHPISGAFFKVFMHNYFAF